VITNSKKCSWIATERCRELVKRGEGNKKANTKFSGDVISKYHKEYSICSHKEKTASLSALISRASIQHDPLFFHVAITTVTSY
jgi:hypothetical protein